MQSRRQLIFDVGLHRGEDTSYYLALGYDVVAFEADPGLVTACRRRFAPEIDEGRLTIVEGAITSDVSTAVTFYRHANSVFGTTDVAWAKRNAHLGPPEPVEVPAVDFAECIREYGTPYYLKVDIEGADKLCFGALQNVSERPSYVSMESEKVDFDALVAELDMLTGLGYERFAVVQQAGLTEIEAATRVDGTQMRFRFERDTSGPFGPDISPWLTREQAIARYRGIFRAYSLFGDNSWLRRSRTRRRIVIRAGHVLRRPLPGWYDTHAARSDASS